MKKLIAMIGLLTVLLAGCGRNDIAKVYEKSESDGIVATYYEMNDGTWQCGDNTYLFRLELTGRMPKEALIKAHYNRVCRGNQRQQAKDEAILGGK